MGAGDWDKMLPEPELLGKYFHEQFKVLPDHQRKRSEWKKGKTGKSSKNKEKRRTKVETCGDVATLSGPPEVELPGNASSFAVFASVRLAVLERWMKQACQIYLSSSSSSPPVDGNSEIDTDSEENTDKTKEIPPLRVPKIVGLGLRSVFELIRESRSSHPLLCTKALGALLDVVQGQQPEGLKNEPTEVIDPLFDLLLDLATSHGPESAAANDGSHLTAVACACLLSLVVVRGDTGKLLSATAALLMCPRALASQNIHMPAVLTALQRSVHGVLLGKVVRPDWITHGVPKNSRIDSFRVKMSTEMHNASVRAKSLASDGQFLYLYTSKGLLKVGSGYGGTIKGHIYLHKADFHVDEKGWLDFDHGLLYFKNSSKKGCELLAVERETFKVSEVVNLEAKDWTACVMFSDGESLGMITSAKDDGFVVRMVNPNSTPVVSVNELPLKLARKCLDVFGFASFDEEANIHTIHTGCEEETVVISAGKDFGLIRTNSGKILYCGKSSSLGIKQGGLRSGKWAELPVTKSPKVVHFAVGHEGLHAILIAEDGTVFFAGTARRGEDGDQNKARRQPKPVKPKKMIKVDGLNIVHAACNNGTTALVSKEGELLMFGKDTAHCDNSTGLVTDLKDVHITHVSLGKAHAVALTNKGHVYTFGINNKGQCGRDFATQIKEVSIDVPMIVAMETTGEEEAEDEELDWEDAQETMCAPGKHKWKHDLCMVCTVCRECTGYSISCLSSMRPDRNPGHRCENVECVEGDSGYVLMMRLDLIFGGRHGARLQDHLQRRLDERKQRQRGRLSSGSSKHCSLKMKGMSNRAGPSTVTVVAAKSVPSMFRPPPPVVPAAQSILVEEQAGSSDVERDASRMTSLPPARVHLPVESPVMQVACGLHHTVLLLQSGEVMTFGSNTYGQLGVGDLLPRGGPTLVKLTSHAVHVAAGSNHTVVLSSKGEVYTFGSFQKGQLGRPSPASGNESPVSSNRKDARLSRDGPWYAYPGAVPNIGPRHGRRATWVGASGDQTYLKIDESLINSLSLMRSTVMANKTSIVLLPTQSDHAGSFKCLAINKRDGNCSSFSGGDQVDFSNTATCLDPLYNVLWSYHPGTHDMTCYNVVGCETRATASLPPSILSPELALPVVASCFVTRSQAALHLLSCLDTLTQAQDQRFTVREDSEDRQAGCGKVYSREDFSAVTRFE
ncbi:hypothetical protein L9F63_008079, partial [Diploptera punctata]